LQVEKTKFLANKPHWPEAVKLERCALCGKPMAATVIRFLPHMAAEVLALGALENDTFAAQPLWLPAEAVSFPHELEV
jgi:hypothetical protein